MKIPHIIRLAVVVLFFSFFAQAQQIKVNKLEPANWWTDMKLNNVQLMVYGENLSNVTASFANAPAKVHNVKNSNYCFVDVKIPAKPGKYSLKLKNSSGTVEIDFPVYARENNPSNHKGFNNEDVIYLITPDRFANGDTGNDSVEGMKEAFDNTRLGRHGGDLQGIINKLDYLKDLGITAIWLNPVVENDTKFSYHGYGATDFYNIDKRFGTNELYREFVQTAHKKGLKVILDHVANHCSIDHPWMKSLPVPEWVNGSVENHLSAQHHKMVLSDIHGDERTKETLQKGWFVDAMPDLNQTNKFVANYIIQNTIWWIEFSGIDGIREDTYPYADEKFLSDWAKAILEEYPDFNIVGEVWTGKAAFLAYYQKNSYMPRKFDSNLPSVTDFAIRDMFYGFLKGEKNIYNIYETFAMDYLYPAPDKLVTFIDNHDVTRAMLAAKGNSTKVKLALGILFTSRGIPQILYGTEIGIQGGEDHGLLRADFPGGFSNSERDAFTKEGRTKEENDLFDFTKKLLELRKKYKALSKGKMIHFPPYGDVYGYVKKYKEENILVIVNASEEKREISLKDLGKFVNFSKTATDLMKDKKLRLDSENTLNIEGSTLLILKL
ncbi:MAG: alpha-amylase family glycosyl hydrolase [Rhodothermaceae bacterium]